MLLIVAIIAPGILLSRPKKADAAAGPLGCLLGNLLSQIGDTAGDAIGGMMTVPVTDRSANSKLSSIKAEEKTMTFKECVLDALVTVAVNNLIKNFTASVVDWINRGFDGSPSFVTNPEGFFANTADQIIGNIIENDFGALGQLLCSPFDLQLRLNIGYNYFSSRNREIGCRLTDVQRNLYGAFTKGSFISAGGWDSWVAVTSVPQNNFYGSYFQVTDSMNRDVLRRLSSDEKQADWGRGFLSSRVCKKYDANKKCLEFGATKTPGSVIEAQVNNQLGSENRKIEMADEVDEILSALINQAMTQTMGKLTGGGLFASQDSSYDSSAEWAKMKTTFEADLAAAQNDSPNAALAKTIADKSAEYGAWNKDATSTVPDQIVERGPVNLAFGKTAKQSSTYTGWSYLPEASVAVDGMRSGNSYYGLTLTNKTGTQWWQVDLTGNTLKTKKIDRIRIYRSVTGIYLDFPFYVYVTNDSSLENDYKTTANSVVNTPGRTLFYKTINPTDIETFKRGENFVEIKLPIPVEGRYVRVHKDYEGQELGLAEVEVYPPEGGTGDSGSSQSASSATPPVGQASAIASITSSISENVIKKENELLHVELYFTTPKDLPQTYYSFNLYEKTAQGNSSLPFSYLFQFVELTLFQNTTVKTKTSVDIEDTNADGSRKLDTSQLSTLPKDLDNGEKTTLFLDGRLNPVLTNKKGNYQIKAVANSISSTGIEKIGENYIDLEVP